MSSPGVGTIQTSTSNNLNIIDEYDCETQSNNINETKLVVENNSDNGIILDRIKLMTASGTWYGIEAACITQQEIDAFSQLDPAPTVPSGMILNVSTCTSGFARQWICIDNEPWDCGPYKQIFYFDTLRPNQYITDAYYADATHIVAQFDSCEPTISPTFSPPTIPPTKSPTIVPTKSPIKLPTISPTILPTKSPVISPSQYSSTINPTLSPSKLRIIDSTIAPSVERTANPTAKPTKNPFISAAVLESTTVATTKVYGESSTIHTNDAYIVAVAIVASLGLCVCALVLIFCVKKSHNSEQNTQTKINELPSKGEGINGNPVMSLDSESVKELQIVAMDTNHGSEIGLNKVNDVTVGAMINDKIFLGINATKGESVVEQHEGDTNDIEHEYVDENSISNVSLYDNYATAGPIAPQSRHNAINFMKPVDQADVGEGRND
eukprot:523868_1